MDLYEHWELTAEGDIKDIEAVARAFARCRDDRCLLKVLEEVFGTYDPNYILFRLGGMMGLDVRKLVYVNECDQMVQVEEQVDG